MDYSLPEDFQIVFDTDALSGVMECVIVTINEDNDVEGEEQFAVTIAGTSLPIELSEDASVTVLITDNDGK